MQALAYIVMLAYVPFCFVAFARWPAKKAVLVTMFTASMFLPANFEGIDPPLLPPLTKELWCPLWVLIACVVMQRSALKARLFSGPTVLMIPLLLGCIGTMLTNTDAIVYGPTVLPGIGPYDLVVNILETAVTWIPPFYLGYALFRTEDDLRQFLRFLVLAGVVYSFLCLWEIRMSPQLHNTYYGYFASEFIQAIRMGGYRPMVFMRHGLNVALFLTVALLGATTLYRAKAPLQRLWTPGRAAAWLLVVLILCKSTGAYFHIAVGLPVILMTSARTVTRVALGFAWLILAYPLLRLFEVIPVDGIYEFLATNVNEERALSLWFRMFTEGQILENTRDRILFGWGGYGRPMEYDPVTGEQLSVLDGYWTIQLGAAGLVGWAAVFGMMLWPVFMVGRALKQLSRENERRLLAGSAFMVALYVFDWVPNSSLAMELTMFTGALAGVVPGVVRAERQRKASLRQARTDAARARRAGSSVETDAAHAGATSG